MAASHNAERVAKSADLKVVKMSLTEDDIQNAALDRLREIQRECEKAIPDNTVFLMDVIEMIGVSTPACVHRRAEKLGVKTYMKRRGGKFNKFSVCVSEEDAERIIRSFYES